MGYRAIKTEQVEYCRTCDICQENLDEQYAVEIEIKAITYPYDKFRMLHFHYQCYMKNKDNFDFKLNL